MSEGFHFAHQDSRPKNDLQLRQFHRRLKEVPLEPQRDVGFVDGLQSLFVHNL